jgi:hypothetical protein
MKLLLPDDEGEIDTVGGLVVSRFGRVPEKGERVLHESGIELEVLDADPRRIKRVRIHRPTTGERSATASGTPGEGPRHGSAEDAPGQARTGQSGA